MNAGPVLWPFTFWNPRFVGRRPAGRSRRAVLAYPGAIWGRASGLRGVLVPTPPTARERRGFSLPYHFIPADAAALNELRAQLAPPPRRKRSKPPTTT